MEINEAIPYGVNTRRLHWLICRHWLFVISALLILLLSAKSGKSTTTDSSQPVTKETVSHPLTYEANTTVGGRVAPSATQRELIPISDINLTTKKDSQASHAANNHSMPDTRQDSEAFDTLATQSITSVEESMTGHAKGTIKKGRLQLVIDEADTNLINHLLTQKLLVVLFLNNKQDARYYLDINSSAPYAHQIRYFSGADISQQISHRRIGIRSMTLKTHYRQMLHAQQPSLQRFEPVWQLTNHFDALINEKQGDSALTILKIQLTNGKLVIVKAQ